MRNQTPELSGLVLDSLTESVAMIDASGVIIGVNAAWRDFAGDNGGECGQYYVGQDYLAACKHAHELHEDESARAMYEGLKSVLDGDRSSFSIEYPCHAPDQPRWFVAHVTRCRDTPIPRFVVAHEDVTVRKLAELKVERTEPANSTFLAGGKTTLELLEWN